MSSPEEQQENGDPPPGNRVANRIHPNARRRQSNESLNPVWAHFRLNHKTNITRCRVPGCDFMTGPRRKDTQFLLKHLEAQHPKELAKFAKDYPDYDRRRHANYFPYRQPVEQVEVPVSSGVRQPSEEELQPFDDEVGSDIMEEIYQDEKFDVKDSEPADEEEPPVKKRCLVQKSPVQHGFLAESRRFNLMVKILEVTSGKFNLGASVSLYSGYDCQCAIHILGTEPIDMHACNINEHLRSIVKNILASNQLSFEHIVYTVVEDLNKLGIADDTPLFPHQVPSYRNKLQYLSDLIDLLTKNYFSENKQQSVVISFQEWQSRNPLAHYKTLILTELEIIQSHRNASINRVLPFFKNFLTELEKETHQVAVDLAGTIPGIMDYVFNIGSQSFCLHFIKAVSVNPALFTYLTNAQRVHAMQSVDSYVQEQRIHLTDAEENGRIWSDELLREANQLGPMDIEERLDYKYLKFWTQRADQFPELRVLANELSAIPSSAYISDH